jgi:hypothetical protein
VILSKEQLPQFMGFEVLTALKMSMLVFLVATPCGLVGGYQRTGNLLPPSSGLNGIYLQVHKAFSPEDEHRHPSSFLELAAFVLFLILKFSEMYGFARPERH